MIVNDNGCGWINQLNKRTNFKKLNQNILCDYLVVGAGFTGLSAARILSEIEKNKRIIIVDALLAGEGASSRNSGYLVDTTLNDGFTSDRDIKNYKIKSKIYELGINVVKKFIREYQVDCDWNECGKYFASSKIKDKKIVDSFSNILSKLNYKNKILFSDDLFQKLGTKFYNVAIHTEGGILLNPAKLARSMVDTLNKNVELYENSELISWKKLNGNIFSYFKNFQIKSKKIIFCTNGFFNSLGIKKSFNFPLTLTASMTRKLSDKEFKSIGSPKEYGILPIRPMGATVRLTKDRRILIRNTAEKRNPKYIPARVLKKRAIIHNKGIQKRFPQLPSNVIEDTWSGIVCRSRNSSQIFEKIDDSIFAAGCYNGSGIGVGTLFGEQIALMASNQESKEISVIQSRKKPTLLPPEPFLNIGISSRLIYERLKARTEI